jgi:hypothetical protein
MSNIARVLEGLINRTHEGKLQWQTTADPDRFLAAVDMIAVVISRLSTGLLLADERYRLEILNDEGTTVEVLETDDAFEMVPSERLPTAEQAQKLIRLFTLARRSDLDTEATLEKLANSLDNF